MIRLAALFPFLASCGLVETDATLGTTRAVWLGGKVTATADPRTGYAMHADAENSFRAATTAIVSAILAEALKAVEIARSNNATKEAVDAGRQATRRAGIDAGVEKARIEADLVRDLTP